MGGEVVGERGLACDLGRLDKSNWCAVDAPLLVALVRAGARFERERAAAA